MDTGNNISRKDHQRIANSSKDHCSKNNTTMIKSQTTNNNYNYNYNSPNLTDQYSWNYLYNNNHRTSFDKSQEDYMTNAFSWPPRSYTCSFCKREFRSAQALGGHMNVHRKDRARLRQSPPPTNNNVIQYGRYGSTTSTTTLLNLNLNHNPNPNLNPSPNFSASPRASPLCSFLSKPPLSYNHDTESKNWPWTSTITDHHADELEDSLTDVQGTDKEMSLCGFGSDEQQEGLAGKSCQGHHYKGFMKKMNETTTTVTATSVRLELEIGLFRGHEPEVRRDLDLELRLGYSNY